MRKIVVINITGGPVVDGDDLAFTEGGLVHALFAFAGALLFVISDTILAFNHFRLKSKPALAASLVVYWAAQWLVAHSVGV